MQNKVILKLWGIWDVLKAILFRWLLLLLIFIFACIIIHTTLKIIETSISGGEYEKVVPIYEEKNEFMNCYKIGRGKKTIVILPAFGDQSPAIQYKTLTNNLSQEYTVVVVEYFGYGYSMSTDKERTNENISNEIKMLLEKLGLTGPYTFIANDISNVYLMDFQTRYPELVDSIISIDGLYPRELNDTYYLNELKNKISNIKITATFELTGFERVLSYIKPEAFGLDKMKELADVYSENDIKIYKNRIANSYLTKPMVNEINKIQDNANEMVNYVYPENLRVLEILSSELIDKYEQNKQNGYSSLTYPILANEVLTNTNNQKVIKIDGKNRLQLYNSTVLLEQINIFLHQE